MVISRPLIRPIADADGKRDQHRLEGARIDGEAEPADMNAVGQHGARDHAGDADDGADGQVDAGGQDDEGLADAEDGVDRDVLGDDQQRLDVEEVRRGEAEIGEDDGERDERAQPHDEQHEGMLPAARLGGRGHCCVWRGHDACFLFSPVR